MKNSSTENNDLYARKLENAIKTASSILQKDAELFGTLLHTDFTPYCRKKRIRAVLNNRKKILKELSALGSKDAIDNFMLFSNTLTCNGGYNHTGYSYNIILASAIWILDQLRLQGNLSEIYQFLPDDFPFGDQLVNLPYISHTTYDYDLIYATAILLIFRNSKDYKKEFLDEDFMTQSVASGPKSLPRLNYESVISFIDRKKINELVDEYENKCWEFYRLAFKLKTLIEKKEDELHNKTTAINTDLLFTQAPAGSPVVRHKDDNLFSNNSFDLSLFGNTDTKNSEKRKNEMKADLLGQFTLTSIADPDSRENTANTYSKLIPSKHLDDIVRFSVADPFDMAFALFYLLDTDSDIPWLYLGSISVAYTVVDQLPFDTPIQRPETLEYCSSINSEIYKNNYSGCRWENSTDCNGNPATRSFGKNLSHILYRYGFSLYPRIIHPVQDLDNCFEELGITDENEKTVYSLLLNLINTTPDSAESLLYYKLRTSEDESPEDDSPEADDKSKDEHYDSICQQNADLRKKNRQLQNALREEYRLKKDIEQQLRSLQSEKEKLHNELSDLRSLVFNVNNVSEDQNVDNSIKFPQNTTAKIVSFGGHPSWISEMKKLLPDVIFCSPETIPNIDLIRGADEIWIQTNCISHAAYYRIINNVSGYNIQLHYFKYSGSHKCADQLIKTER